MDSGNWSRLRELFDNALGLSAPDRAAYLDRECQDEPELRTTLDSLLDHAEATGTSLEQAVLEVLDLDEAMATELMLVGRRLGHYQILEKIGRGGMGEVFLGLDTRLGRQVAIKILPDAFTHHPERMARFEREARTLAALNHPNIATIHGLEQVDGVHFLVLELIEGDTLRSRLSTGPCAADEVLDIATQIAEGLAKAHQAGIVHRDLKPDNLMLTGDGLVKILDFGLAKEVVGPEPRDSFLPTEPELETALGQVMGTSAYMSPEQARGEPVDHRSDQFAFGAVLYEVASGKRAFSGETVADTMVAVMRHDPEPPADYTDRVPGPLRRVIDRCLAKEPGKRYDSTDELARELRHLRRRSSELDALDRKPEDAAARRISPSQLIGLLLMAVALIAAGVVWWPSRGTTDGRPVADPASVAVSGNESARQELSDALVPTPTTASIAVLPLENLGPTDEAYFADGMTDALITQLARIEALKVISRISVMQYRDTTKPISEIADELGVETLLVGSVLHGGDRVRISTQLIDAGTDRNLWADSYERDLEDILGLQSEVAQAVTRAVQVETQPEEAARIAASRSVDPAAHEAYLRGLEDLQGKRDDSPREEELLSAIEHFQRAIATEPDWAQPWAKLAQAQHWIASRGGIDIQAEYYPQAKASALRAIDLDESVAQGHAALGFVLANHEWNWAGALKAYQRAIELDPNLTAWYYGTFLRDAGYYEEAVQQFERAVERTPNSPLIQNHLGRALVCAGRFDDAEDHARRLIARYPESPLGHLLLARIYATTSRYEEAVGVYQWVSEAGPSTHPWVSRSLGYALARTGDLEGAKTILRDLEVAGFDWMPSLYLMVDREDEAVAQVEAAFAARRDVLLQVRCNPDYGELSANPRIREILEGIGFPAGGI